MPPPANTGGRLEKPARREVVDTILYVVRAGCSWHHLPTDLPPWQTLYWCFARWKEAGAPIGSPPPCAARCTRQSAATRTPPAVSPFPAHPRPCTDGTDPSGNYRTPTATHHTLRRQGGEDPGPDGLRWRGAIARAARQACSWMPRTPEEWVLLFRRVWASAGDSTQRDGGAAPSTPSERGPTEAR
ncbi:transposase (plasmid) [Nocardiopsis flavescens]|nr:transposase [Nocardiopsis flavescens]